MANSVFGWFSKSSQLSVLRKQIVVQEQKLLAKFPMPVILVNSEGKILFANDLAIGILHKDPTTLLNLTTTDFGLNPKDYNVLSVKSLAKDFLLTVDDKITLKATISKWKRSLFLIVLGLSSSVKEPISSSNSTSKTPLVPCHPLATNEQNFIKQITDTLPIALAVKDSSGKYILWNKKCEEIFEVSSENVVGKLDYRLNATKEQTDLFQQTEKNIFEKRESLVISKELLSTSNGDIKILNTIKTPLFSSEGDPLYIVTTSNDITEQTRLERKIKEDEDKELLLLDYLPQSISLIEDGKIIYVNTAFMTSLEYTDFQQVLGEKFEDFLAKEDQQKFKDLYENVVQSRESLDKSIDLQLKGEKGKSAHVSLRRIVYSRKKMVLCCMETITTSSDDFEFQRIFVEMPFPAFILSAKGYISLINKSGQQLFELTDQDKELYRHVYIKPLLTANVRKKIKQGKSASMPYLFDFAKMASTLNKHSDDTRKLPLNLTFMPIDLDKSKEAKCPVDYCVFVEAVQGKQVERNEAIVAVPTSIDDLSLLLPNTDPYLLCDNQFTILTSNDLFCSLSKYSAENLVNKNLKGLLCEESLSTFENDLQYLQENGKLVSKEYKLKTVKKNEVCLVKVSASKVKDYFLFVFHNLMFHKQIMQILDERSSQLSALLEATDGIVFSVDLSGGKFGKIERASKGFTKALGYSHEEMWNMTLNDLFVDCTQKKNSPMKALNIAQKELLSRGKSVTQLGVRSKSGKTFEASITMSLLITAKKESVLIVLQNLTQQLKEIAAHSPQAKELQTVRDSLPGLYVKVGAKNDIVEIYSNMALFSKDKCNQLIGKEINALWTKEIGDRILEIATEAKRFGINSKFEFTSTDNNATHTYQVRVMPIAHHEEFVLWIEDLSQEEQQYYQIRSLYQLTSAQGLTLTERVDKLLEFGCSLFHMELGMVLRLEEAQNGFSTSVIYATQNNLHLEQQMEFPLGECLQDILDGNAILSTDLNKFGCEHCIHKNKKFSSMVAAPIYVENEIQGILCFASTIPQNEFAKGTEEILGVMSQFLGLRIELRQVNKIVEHASRALVQSLEHLEAPAIIVDANFRIMQVNDPLLILTGRNYQRILGKELFKELVHVTSEAKSMFISTANKATNSFQTVFDTRIDNGGYEEIAWNVFVCDNSKGKRESYLLLANFY